MSVNPPRFLNSSLLTGHCSLFDPFMNLKQILLGTGLLYLSCNSATLAQLAPKLSNQVATLSSNYSAPPSPHRGNRGEPWIQEEEDHTKLRSNIVVETDAGRWGGGDGEKMNVRDELA